MHANDGGVPVRGGGGGGMGLMFAGMGLQMAGQTIGGGTGQVLSNVGMAANLMSMLQMIPKVNIGMGKLAGTSKIANLGVTQLSKSFADKAKNLSGLSRAFGPVLRGLSLLARAFSPVGIATALAIFGVKKLIDAYKENQETIRKYIVTGKQIGRAHV